MASLPAISGRTAVAAFKRAGFEAKRQTGSHIILVKSGSVLTLSVPNHRELKPGTLRALIRKSGLSVAEFTELLRQATNPDPSPDGEWLAHDSMGEMENIFAIRAD